MARRRLRTRSVSIRGGGGVLYRRRLRAPRAGIARGCRRGGVREARVRRTPARGVPLFRHGDGPRRVHVRLGARGWARVHLRMGRRRSARPRRRGTPERAGRVPNLRADARRRPRGGGRRAGERLETSRGVREPRRARVHVGKRFVRPTRSRRSRHAIRAQDGGGASGVNVTAVAAGARHTVAVDDMGEVYAWGSNERGELGLDPPPPRRANTTEPIASASRMDSGVSTIPPPPAPPPPAHPRRRRLRPKPNRRRPTRRTRPRPRVDARALLRMDTEDDPEGAFDLIFERLRDATDASGGSAHAHNTFKALISGVEPTTPPPWTLPEGTDAARLDERFWGWMVGQSRDSAGRVSYLASPQLVRGVAQSLRGRRRRRVHPRRSSRVSPRDVPRPRHGRVRRVRSGTVFGSTQRVGMFAVSSRILRARRRIVAVRRVRAGSYAGEEGASTCHLCPVGTFLGFGGGVGAEQCIACSPGTFSASEGRAACDACAPGSYQPASAATACEACPAATYLPGERSRSASDCLACPSGSFGDAPGSSSCARCPPGTRSSAPGLTSCDACASGTYARGGKHGVRTLSRGHARRGRRREGTHECEACPAGSYSSATGATECAPCPAGFYSEIEGAAGASRAPRGLTARRRAERPSRRASRVPADSIIPRPVERSPSPTRASSRSVSRARWAPSPTSRGRWNVTRVLRGRTSTKPGACARGLHACSLGTFAPVSGLDVCLLCPPGTFMNETGATACHGCDPGYFNDEFGSGNRTACQECPPGSYADVSGTGNCTLCPRDSTSPSGRASGANRATRDFTSRRQTPRTNPRVSRATSGRTRTRRGWASVFRVRREASPTRRGRDLQTVRSRDSVPVFRRERIVAVRIVSPGTRRARPGHVRVRPVRARDVQRVRQGVRVPAVRAGHVPRLRGE